MGAFKIKLLGPVEVWVDDFRVDAGPPRRRAVLAALAVDAGRMVSMDTIIDRVWGESPPEKVRAGVHANVTRIRNMLDTINALTNTAKAYDLTRRSNGYVLNIDPLLVDLHRFRHIVTTSRERADHERAELLRNALDLWRGRTMADLSGEWPERMRVAWTEQWLDTQVQWARTELQLGHYDQVISAIRTVLLDHPLVEPLVAILMQALITVGRAAEALDCYANARARLAETLGADPGPELQKLHQAILDGTVDQPRAPASGPAALVPHQLPAAPRSFTGRRDELATLTTALDTVAGPSTPMVITAVAGAGGMGKTWLALHWAYHNLDQFPDGQLFVDLQGFSPAGNPMTPAVAVRGFLTGLGVDPQRIPPDPHAQTALYRSLVAGRRILVLLDNAAEADQVVPLLPGSSSCTVLVTSRRHLTSLITRHSARHLRVGALTEAEALQLLTTRLGRERLAAEPDAIVELLACCAGHPLALSIVAGHASIAPKVPLAELAADLGDTTRCLDALDDDDPATSLPAVLSWSLRGLTPQQRTVFGLLGIAPGPDISLSAAISLTGLPPAHTRRALRTLAEVSLLDRDVHGRYSMHDLIRTYAAEMAHDHLDNDTRATALRRILDFYIHTAYAADRVLYPHRQPIPLDPPAPGTRPDALPDLPAGMAWFDIELPNLLAAQHTATTQHWHHTVWHLAWTLNTYQFRRGHRPDRLAMWQAALDATTHLPDPTPRIVTHRQLGQAYTDLSLPDQATEHLYHALTLAERHHNPNQQAHTHHTLAWAWERRGDYRRGIDHGSQALRLYRALRQPAWEADALNVVGWCAAQLGDYDTARTHCQAAFTLYSQHNSPTGQAGALDNLGYIEFHTGHRRHAIDHYRHALILVRQLGNTAQVVYVLDHLGHPHAALGQHGHARTAWREAVQLCREQGRDADAARIQQQLDNLDAAAYAAGVE